MLPPGMFNALGLFGGQQKGGADAVEGVKGEWRALLEILRDQLATERAIHADLLSILALLEKGNYL